MGIIDIIILCCFLPALYFGIKNGFIKQIISLAVLILGIILSLRFTNIVAEWILKFVDMSGFWVKVIAFIVIFFIVAILLNLLGAMLNKIIKITMLGWLNRVLGIIFSVVKIALLLSVLIYIVDSINNLTGFIPAEKITESNFYHYLLKLANTLFPYLRTLFQ